MRHLAKYFLLILVSVLAVSKLSAQKRTIYEADILYEVRAYEEAIPLYKQIVDLKKSKPVYKFKLAECYRHIKNYENAAKIYKELKEDGYSPINYFFEYGKTLMHLGQYDTAYVYFRGYKQMGGMNESVEMLMKSALWAPEHMTEKDIKYAVERTHYKVGGLYIGGGYNENNDIVYSTPNIEVDKKNDVIYPNYKKKLIKVENGGTGIGNIKIKDSTRFYIGAPTFNKDNSVVYFTKTYSDATFVKPKDYKKHKISSNGVNNLGIYSAVVMNGDWINVEPLGIDSFNFTCMDPSLSKDEKRLYFSSNRPDGFGGFDIWFIEKNQGEWSNVPINVGPQINTVGDEMFPYSQNDSVLYFSSDGMLGYGGADIYRTVLKDSHGWTSPTNLGYDLNSSADDFGIIFKDLNNGVFASGRTVPGMKDPTLVGNDNIYSFSKTMYYEKGSGQIFDQFSHEYVPNAKVEITKNGDLITTVTANSKGFWKYDRFKPDSVYQLKGTANGYFPDSIMYDLAKGTSDSLNLYLLRNLKVGDKITINNVLFDYNKYSLLSEAKIVLDRLATLLIRTKANVELSAFTDSRGSSDYNMKLSVNRAHSCVDYLVSIGVDRDIISYSGFGETHLLNGCESGVSCTEEQHAVNRRVEVNILNLPTNIQNTIKKGSTKQLYNMPQN